MRKQTITVLDPEDELKEHWDNELLSNKNSYYSLHDSEHRETPVPKRLRMRPAITVQGSKYQGRVIDRSSLAEEDNSLVGTEDAEEKEDSLFEFEEKKESDQDSVEASVEQSSVSSGQGILRITSETQEQLSKGQAIIEQKSLYDDILKLRIAMQRLLTIANCFPDEQERRRLSFWKKKKKKNITRTASEDSSSDVTVEIDRLWRKLKRRNSELNSFKQKVLDFWDKKVREATGTIYDQTSKFKVINQSVSNQIQGVLSNRERLFRRAHTRRDSNRSLLCLLSSENNGVDPEIYDDGDFYQLLLKEVVNDMSKVSKREDIKSASQLKRNRQRKQYLDRRESKGRRLKYTVHDKLVGFLAPIPMEQSETRNQLLKSLFGSKHN
ncbi:uncharacterized protein Gasu_23050 [Galdieria sulphuraria]|uniref:Apoptosis-antagonizing transcription factor C-terminal domain-containing protein n=1 Tax=Galdieria sulphuraria TaxID=130081 RepID=M2Y381_GALSU|nr:uncharacterized protein Gasu_23050 [Galdieria sulphuraria]EME30398.1 hypothetical protein Gasu_23050 [Galdieria sulphuraria]|eukprot:XP_005706918.1 hypothetical protein Gasu_23050 [Galdieria sulphuraria]